MGREGGTAATARMSTPAAVETFVFDGRRVQSVRGGDAAPPAATPHHGARPARRHHDDGAGEGAQAFSTLSALRPEVERFGAQGLDARSRKAWEAQRLESLGVASPKRPRIPPNIGFGMAKKAQQRAEQARLTEAAVNGDRLGKKKKRPDKPASRGDRDAARGVVWGGATGNSFRQGMLHLGSSTRDGARPPATAIGLAAFRPGGGRGKPSSRGGRGGGIGGKQRGRR